VLAGTSAARHLGWPLPDGDWPVELYVSEAALVDVIEEFALKIASMASEEPVDVVLRAVPDPWAFPPHFRVVPEVVAALDLAESVAPAIADLGRVRLKSSATSSGRRGTAGAAASVSSVDCSFQRTRAATPPAAAAFSGRPRRVG
jgi:hypothetical protein